MNRVYCITYVRCLWVLSFYYDLTSRHSASFLSNQFWKYLNVTTYAPNTDSCFIVADRQINWGHVQHLKLSRPLNATKLVGPSASVNGVNKTQETGPDVGWYKSAQPCYSSYQALMTEAEIVSETLNMIFFLIRLTTQRNFAGAPHVS